MRFRILLAAALLFAAPAFAQFGSMHTSLYSPELNPEFSARDLKVMIRVLELTPEAQDALRALYDNYTSTLKREGDRVRELADAEAERAELLNDSSLLEPARKRLSDFSARAIELRKTFLDDLKSLLTREQEANWPILERELRRIKSIPKGRLAGESLDIVRLTEDLIGDTQMPPQVLEILGTYRLEIDRALVARDTLIAAESKSYNAALKDDPEKAKGTYSQIRDRRTAVRDINERYARLIAAELPDDKRTSLEKKIFELSYPMLIRPTRVDEYLKGAAELESLTADQRTQLKGLKARRDADTLAWAKQAAVGWRRMEEEELPGELAKALGQPHDPSEYTQRYNGSWLPEDHPLVQARLQRLELDRALRSQLDQILSAEQRAEVPTRIQGTAKFENWVSWQP
jgi:Spy/CpxP family protein refolding chaperone